MSDRPRDQDLSAFATILTDAMRRVAGAFAAILVDGDGECVDYAIAHAKAPYDVVPFDVKVAGAHWAIVLAALTPAFAGSRTLVVRGDRRSFLVRTLPDGYALVFLVRRRGGFVDSSRALDACERALAQEAAWSLEYGRGVWSAVDVETDERARPVWLSMGPLSCGVEVLGALTRLRKRERGWRVRLASGGELNLVREVGDRWYADERLA